MGGHAMSSPAQWPARALMVTAQDASLTAYEQQVSPEADVREARINSTSDFLVRASRLACGRVQGVLIYL